MTGLPSPQALRAWLAPRVKIECAGFVSPCWVWMRSRNHGGYARYALPKNLGGDGKKKVALHRLSYEVFSGLIPAGLQIDHLCRNRSCLNPEHLEPVTARENSRRRPQSPLCPKGHLMRGSNVMVRRAGWRVCRACQRERLRRYRRAKGILPQGSRVFCGEQASGAKLTTEQVLQIRASKAKLRELSEQFGVAKSTLSLIRNGKSWRHLNTGDGQ